MICDCCWKMTIVTVVRLTSVSGCANICVMPSKIRITFGRNVSKLRYQRKLTQQQLAEKIGVDRSYEQRIESGKARPSEEIVLGLTLALECPFEALNSGGPRTLDEWRRLRDEEKDKD